MVEAGLPLSRATVGALLVHPLLDATLVIWRRDRGAYLDDTPRPAVRGDEAWRRSPFYRLEQADRTRAALPAGAGRGHRRIRRAGRARGRGRDRLLALRTRLAAGVTLGDGTSVFSSWITDRPGGFADGRARADPRHRAAAGGRDRGGPGHRHGRHAARHLSRRRRGGRVLGGDIERGRVEMIHAVIWYSDLAGFTRLTDQVSGAGMLQLFAGHAEILGLLNDHAEILVDAIEARGGQVLKFMGDGILAIFRGPTRADACEAALDGLDRGEPRAAPGWAGAAIGETHPYLALHAGDVLYGNIGGRARLDFTVLGPAVNEASRIAALCRQLDQPVIMSEAFAERCPTSRRARLLALGRYALRGVARPQMLYGLEPPAAGSAARPRNSVPPPGTVVRPAADERKRCGQDGMAHMAKNPPGSARGFRRSWCWSAPPATWRGASCCPGCSISRAPASFRAAGSSASRSTRSTPTASARSRATRSTSSRHAQGRARPTGRPSPQTLDYVPLAAGADALQGGGRARPSSRSAGEMPPPALPERAAERGAVGGAACSARPASSSARRIIMEKPFGTDLASAVALNAQLHEVFDEEQIFRIDHFLGKEPAQNILAFRFANGLFEPIWNRNFIDHVQIDVPETLGLGKRAGVLRGDRRLSRHGGDAPVPDPRLHGDGAADRARAGADQRGEEQGLPQHAADRARATSCAGNTPATAPRRASIPSRTPRPSSR